jgi:DNA recombination protein RmuC
MHMTDAILIATAVAILVIAALLLLRLQGLARIQEQAHAAQTALGSQAADQGERLRVAIAEELRLARGAIEGLKLAQVEALAANRESSQQRLAELGASLQKLLADQARADQELLLNTLRSNSQQLGASIETMTRTVDGRLEQISGKVTERLDEGFKKTNETFVNVMARLAVIDEAQKKIENLTGSVVSLQELLGDKRARGAFGEVQLEALVRDVMPANSFEFQFTLSNGSRADCVLKLPEPTGLVAVDSKFPLENYRRMLDPDAQAGERAQAKQQFRADVKKHVDDIQQKYIIANETSDGAVMFVPAEAVFAEIHAYHPELVEHANGKRVWIVSPTTLMAILNTTRAVLKDVETRKQIHVIKEALARLARDFALFDERMKKLADHIRLANKDVDEIQVSSRKITHRFAQIESVEIEQRPALPDADEA